jgi:hypothetical protein
MPDNEEEKEEKSANGVQCHRQSFLVRRFWAVAAAAKNSEGAKAR